ncbi:hypothetical protein BHE74_00017247 [Ensete ventricosum]|nr:hypothetical protein GW17_00028714 [Ensete ventricosum]RWW74791.1 hypothetical protein BHE74_00017247 [Ensete ventricosum]RZR89771.1 hypothetical protein BHM03_00017560 [Ensete ventricosum]
MLRLLTATSRLRLLTATDACRYRRPTLAATSLHTASYDLCPNHFLGMTLLLFLFLTFEGPKVRRIMIRNVLKGTSSCSLHLKALK